LMLKYQFTERYGGVINIRASYSDGMRFESLGGYHLLVVRFYVVSFRPHFVKADKKNLSLYGTN
jgi:hypothetical protein